MNSNETLRLFLLCNILDTLYLVVQAEDGRTQAFFDVEGDLHYLINGVTMKMQEFYRTEDTSSISFSDSGEENLNAYASPIVFHPPMLNFQSHSVGMPSMEHVIVQNLSPDTSIHMLSISGNTMHTHCSFFQEKVIPPGGNTSFDVVLLAREEGPVDDTLFIHTSLGSFKFQISAVGIPNPYRLRPFVGVRMPLNSSYTSIIHMHNPHGTTLQVTEIYSSGGNLHLELLGGENAALRNLWEIPPYQTKPIIKANFIARVEKNHTVFIRIKMNSSLDDYLLLPLEIDVSSTPGLYATTDELDFGVLRSQDNPKMLSLSLLNSGLKHVHITNVIATPVNEAMEIKLMNLKIPPGTLVSTQVATITFNPSRALHLKQCCGKIVIKSKNNQFKIQIPYQAQLLQGSLGYNENSTKFFVGLQNDSKIKEFNVTNNFSVVIVVYNVSLPKDVAEHFSLSLKTPVILQVGKSATVAWLTYKSAAPNLQLTSYIRIHTNISFIDFPILCFTGRLKVFLLHSLNESYIDFGTLGLEDNHTAAFAVINENPVEVNLKYWGSDRSKTFVDLVGVEKGNASTLVWRQNFSSMMRSLILKPQHYAIFYIGITAPKNEGMFQGLAFVETQFEKIHVPFSFRTAKGSLKVDDLNFENSFPGKLSTRSLYIHSTFSHSMTVTGISTVPEDSRFDFDFIRYRAPVLHPNCNTTVGKIIFDQRKFCKQKCYSGLPTTTNMGLQWMLGMPLPSEVGKTDSELLRTLYRRWHNLAELEEKIINITLRIDTTEVRGFLLKAHATLQWPRMLSKYKIKFPITQIGNHTVKDFTLENPSSLPVLVQVVPLWLYPNPENILTILKEIYEEEYFSNNILNDSEAFYLNDLESINLNPDNHIGAYRKSIEEFFGIQSHKKSIAMLLTPGMRVRIQVGFTPQDDNWKSSLILIRNNLTVMDAVLIQGQGGYGKIKLGNVPPGNDSILTFEITDSFLKVCDNLKSPNPMAPDFTVKRTFTAKNTGVLPFHIKLFDISGKFCQGYGFQILNCQPFELKPNASKKIDIIYTPDFSSTHVEKILSIHTTQGPEGQTLQYKIVATVPRHLLEVCFKALPRPSWEQYVYFLFTGLSFILFIAVLICGYLDSKHVLQNTFFPIITVYNHDEKFEKESIFDLNAICANIDENYGYSEESDNKNQSFIENTTVPENDFILSSMKNLEVTNHKKEPITVKNLEESVADYYRHSKKRTPKKQILESCCSEANLVDIKKTQPRNSWTRFLKPPFSFHSCSNMNNKPSVATQTIVNSMQSDTVKSFKELDAGSRKTILDVESNKNINYFINIDNDVKYKNKSLTASKYTDCNNFIKKDNGSPTEEETSSTTTESDLSEKDNHFVYDHDTYVSKKIWYSANRDASTNCTSAQFSKSPTTLQRKEFHLNTKNKSQTKIKEPAKILHNEIRPHGALELPYKSFLLGITKEDLEKSCTDALGCNTSQPLSSTVSDSFQGITTVQPQDCVLHTGIHNCLWIENENCISCFDPASHSATITKNIFKSKTKNGIRRNNLENLKIYGDWPGFDLKSIRESYWDTNYNPSQGTWADKTENIDVTQNISDSLWNMSLASIWEPQPVAISSTNDGCNSVGKPKDEIISSEPIPVKNTETLVEFKPFHTSSALWIPQSNEKNENIDGCTGSEPIPVKNMETSVEFKPFHTSSALWIPHSNEKNENTDGCTGKSTWSFSLFSDPSQILSSESLEDPQKKH